MATDDEFDAAGAAAELEAALAEHSAADLEADLVILRAKLADAEDRAGRAEAEMAGARERMAREAALQVASGTQRVLLDVVTVLDDLERALEAARVASDESPLARGIELVRQRFRSVLAGHGVTPIEAAGQPFDPQVHEAISVVPATVPAQDGLVVAVLRGGYRIGDKLLRPAGVVVGKLTGG